MIRTAPVSSVLHMWWGPGTHGDLCVAGCRSAEFIVRNVSSGQTLYSVHNGGWRRSIFACLPHGALPMCFALAPVAAWPLTAMCVCVCVCVCVCARALCRIAQALQQGAMLLP